MKKIILFLLFLGPILVFSQEMEGRIRYLVVNNWTKQMEHLDYLSKQQREKVAYMWGNRSEWKSYSNLFFKANQTKYEASEEKAEPEEEGGYSWRKDVFFMKRDFDKNTQYDGLTMLGKTYLVEDSLAAPKWRILNDLKEVAGHVCMKAFAQDTVRKQKIIAWFAQDILHSGGPAGFYGLPGMILEIDVNEGAMVLTADLIEMKKLTTELDPPAKLKGKKIKQADYDKLIKAHIKEKTEAEEPWFWGIRYI
jgi:GLPGLI family protein